MNRSARFVLSLAAAGLVAGVLPAAAAPPAEAPPASPANAQGFLYGTVTAKSGTTYQGRLRWSDEEAFWGDHFNGAKEEPDFLRDLPDGGRRRQPIKILGIPVGVTTDHWGHVMVARFGDIDRIEVLSSDEARLFFKGGDEIEIDGGSNDVDTTITVWDKAAGEIELEWRRIRTIQFQPAPAGLTADVQRAYGVVKTTGGEFRGYVQWDQEECLSTDKIDGDGPDGKVSIQLGQIRAIERNSRSSSRLHLKDGRDLVLDGTNDVDDDNRGIFVEDVRYGRVLIPWSEFERVDFSDGGSGPAYGEFKASHLLKGKVEAGGRTLDGRIIFDLDETSTWEMLNGERHGIEYSIPFGLVKTIVPRRDRSDVTLRSGEKLELEKGQDVGDDNGGALVYVGGAQKGEYVEWADIDRIEFD